MLTVLLGAKKITSLGCYPLKYHKNEEKVRRDLIERGKKFVTLSGVNYKSHQGMAYYKKKKNIIKVWSSICSVLCAVLADSLFLS